MSYLFKHNFYIFFLLILFVNPICVFPQSIHFNHLTTEDGLSNNNVYDIIQDKLGFIWFATDDGLNRFDGYDFKIYRNDPAGKAVHRSDRRLPAGIRQVQTGLRQIFQRLPHRLQKAVVR